MLGCVGAVIGGGVRPAPPAGAPTEGARRQWCACGLGGPVR